MQDKIVEKWVEKLLANYPIKPVIEVRQYIEEAAEKIVRNVLDIFAGKGFEIDEEAIDNLMRFLATDRSLSPGDSIKLVMDLKHIIAEKMKLDVNEKLKLYEILDDVACKAFDHYMACREKIFELKLKEKDRDIEMMRKIIEYADKAKF